MKRILSLLLLMPGALNAYLEATELDLGSEKRYKELKVTAALTQEPCNSIPNLTSSHTLTRHYTQSNARLHCSLDKAQQCDLSTDDYAACIELPYFGLQKNSTEVIVRYELTQLPWFSILYNPTTLESKTVHVTIGEAGHTTAYHGESRGVATLAIVAKWEQYRITKKGRHVEITATDANDGDDNDSDDANDDNDAV